MERFARLTAVAAAAVLCVGGVVIATNVAQADDTGHKVWVCKYVGKPGAEEVLKGGKNPIQVDMNATVGTWFKDGQNSSYVIGVVGEGPAPSVDDCPAAPNPPTETSTPTPSEPPVTETSTPTPSEPPGTETPRIHKVWVCKYVGTPGEDERLKEGKNPILVDWHSTDGPMPEVGAWFNDAQGRSYVVALEDADPEPTREDCPSVTPSPSPSPSPSESPSPSPSPSESPSPSPSPSESPSPSPTTAPTTSKPTTPAPTKPVKHDRGVRADTGAADDGAVGLIGLVGLIASAGALVVTRRR